MATKEKKPAAKPIPLFDRVREILESARVNVARTVNTTQVVANWLIGREIVEEEQRGKKRADYGHKALADLSARLGREYGRGYSVDNLEAFRQFYLDYSRLISETASRNLNLPAISDTVRRESGRKLAAGANSDAVRRNSDAFLILPQMNLATSGKTWQRGELAPIFPGHTIARCCALAASRREEFMKQLLISNPEIFLPELRKGMLFERDA